MFHGQKPRCSVSEGSKMEWNRDYRQAIDFVSVAMQAPGFNYPTNDFY